MTGHWKNIDSPFCYFLLNFNETLKPAEVRDTSITVSLEKLLLSDLFLFLIFHALDLPHVVVSEELLQNEFQHLFPYNLCVIRLWGAHRCPTVQRGDAYGTTSPAFSVFNMSRSSLMKKVEARYWEWTVPPQLKLQTSFVWGLLRSWIFDWGQFSILF